MVFGAGGMLGRELLATPPPPGLRLTGLTHGQADLAFPDQVARALAQHRPALVINAAAFSNVDAAETEQAAALAGNAQGPENLARACREQGIPLIHVSTDYVFGGRSDRPYREDDPPDPVNFYGLSKLRGEEAVRAHCPQHLIVRTAWLFGALARNFIHLMLELMRTRPLIKVVQDQVGCPTPAGELARALLGLASAALEPGQTAWGTYHLCGPLTVSRFHFAQMIWEAARPSLAKELVIEPVGGDFFPSPARRPTCTALDCAKIRQRFGLALGDWRPELGRIVNQLLQPAENRPHV